MFTNKKKIAKLNRDIEVLTAQLNRILYMVSIPRTAPISYISGIKDGKAYYPGLIINRLMGVEGIDTTRIEEI